MGLLVSAGPPIQPCALLDSHVRTRKSGRSIVHLLLSPRYDPVCSARYGVENLTPLFLSPPACYRIPRRAVDPPFFPLQPTRESPSVLIGRNILAWRADEKPCWDKMLPALLDSPPLHSWKIQVLPRPCTVRSAWASSDMLNLA